MIDGLLIIGDSSIYFVNSDDRWKSKTPS